ncbi:sigma-70 family RNA polymerase sigma factor [Nonomuraea sp. NPDC023979]|uniref:sigma-70 family RNA polymerase sigma factor n=1 Tax=Nonomuraea sp. NPDC023979 TaxID=3154796 RepID=UPI0033F8EE18
MSAETSQSDAELIQAVRGGDATAYGRLYERHVAAARVLARRLVPDDEAEDVVAEAFTRVLDVMGRGDGPEAAFRTHLLTVVRRTADHRTRLSTGPETADDEPVRAPAAVAYQSLPERWRAVLWHVEVEGARPAEVAPLLGLSANGAAALAYRAREGLRQAYLQTRLTASPPLECRPVLGKLGAYVKGGLTRRESKPVDEHVRGCDACRTVLAELTDVRRALRTVVAPLLLGPAAGGYVAAMSSPVRLRVRRTLAWVRALPGRQHVVVATGALTVMAVAAAFALVSADRPDTAPVSQPLPIEPSHAEPPSSRPRPAPPSRVPAPPSRVPARESAGPPAGTPAKARLTATISAMGALVRDRPGIVAMRLRNTGKKATAPVYAAIDLPPGVTPVPPGARPSGVTSSTRTSPATHGRAAPVGAVDGWSCRLAGRGVRCARRPLGAGEATAVFLRVQVASAAPGGEGPTLRVEAGPLRARAESAAGVRASGAPARFAADGKVAVRATGNSFVDCPDGHDDCAMARRRHGDQRDNDLWPMRPQDQDDEPDTPVSSAARLALPKGARAVWAGLYWSAGAPEAGEPQEVAPVRLRAPGRKRYVEIRPTHVDWAELPSGPAYQAFAEVTSLVNAVNRSGTWWAAAPRADLPGHAGWSLVVVVSAPDVPYSRAVVLDSAAVVGGEHDLVRMPLGGLGRGAADARAQVVVWEGDADLKGDKVSLGTGPLTPSGGDRDRDNVFDGSSGGAGGMTFGVDVDTITGRLGSRPWVSIASERDAVMFGVAAVSVRAEP